MYIVKTTATNRDGATLNVYVANSNNTAPFTTSQRDAARYDTKADAGIVTGFRIVKLVPRRS